MEPLVIVLALGAVSFLFTWIASLVTGDNSWVDRLWSIVPVVYVWVFAGASIVAGAPDPRLILMALLVTAWGARLTFNFARKGGYSGTEDYRWPILRARMSKAQFWWFNLLFIALYQNALIVAFTLPAQIAWEHRGVALTGWDLAFALLFLALLIGEFVADQQQWDFHRAKRAAGGTLEPGFVTTGLWRLSRHPNFFFEQAQWWVFYLIGATAAVAGGAGIWGGAVNWTIAGAFLLSALFVGSTIFTESITASKYPAYAEYQRTTSMIVPWPPRRGAQPAEA